MTQADFHHDNHYVPCEYLKAWESSPGRVCLYRVLVSHGKVPLWNEKSIRGVAYHAHLYTRLAVGGATDEIEKWFDREYETPAAEVLQKVISDSRLQPSDWRVLIRFLSAQDVRTPARLVEFLRRWYESFPGFFQMTLEKSVEKLESMKACGEEIRIAPFPQANYFPIRVTTEIQRGQEFGTIKAESIVGRALWLFSIKHLLTKTAEVLQQHRWTIMAPPKGTEWFTSDDPVVRLNFHNHSKYDFGGGWGSKGTEIFMPISPTHLLYTQVGSRPPQRGTQFSSEQAEIIRRCIAEHAHRFIFAAKPDANMASLRPRTVSADLLKDEDAQWSKWHEEQTEAERKLMERSESQPQQQPE